MKTETSKANGPYFIEEYGGTFQVREDHEALYGIPGGSGLCCLFNSRLQAECYMRGRNDGWRAAQEHFAVTTPR